MESLASGIESETARTADENMNYGAGKKKKRMSKKNRKKSSTYGKQVRLPYVCIVFYHLFGYHFIFIF